MNYGREVIEEGIRFDNAIALLPPSTHASDLRRFWRERFNRVTWSIQMLCQNRSNRLRGVIGNRVSDDAATDVNRWFCSEVHQQPKLVACRRKVVHQLRLVLGMQ